MWVLSFLPNWIFHLVVIAGVLGIAASFILKFIPFVSQYKLPIQAGAVLALVVGIWFEGGISNNDAWLARVAEMEKKVAEAEAKSADANVKIITKIVEKEKVVKEKTDANVKIIEKVVAKELDASCKLTNASVVLHNSASQNEVSGSAVDSARGTSEVKASELLSTVTENYGTYYQVVERLKGWQDWYKEQKKIFEEISK